MQKIKNLFKMYQSFPASLKAGIWFTFCNLLLKELSLISLPLFTRMLSTREYGILTLYTSTQYILVVIGTWDLGYGAFQKGLFKYREEEIGHLDGSTVLFGNAVTIAVYGVLFLSYRFIRQWILFPPQILFVLMLYTMFQPAYRNWTLQKQKNYQYKPVVIMTLLVSVGSVLCAYLALQWVSRTANVKYGADLLFLCIITGIFWIRALHLRQVLGNIQKTWEHIKFIVSFQAPCVLHSLSLLVLGQADRIMIGHMVGKSEAAFYGVAYNLASAITIFQNSLEIVMIPWRYRKLEEKHYDEIGKNSNQILFFIGCFICLFILVAPEAMMVLFTENYHEAIWSIPPIALSVYYIFLYSIFTSIETYFEKTKYIMYVSVSCSALNIILNYLLIDKLGYIVCGYTTLFSYICFAVGHYYFMKKVCNEKIPGIQIFCTKKILIYSGAVSVFVFVVTIIYPYAFLRYLILTFFCITAVILRNKILDYIRYIWRDVKQKRM